MCNFSKILKYHGWFYIYQSSDSFVHLQQMKQADLLSGIQK